MKTADAAVLGFFLGPVVLGLGAYALPASNLPLWAQFAVYCAAFLISVYCYWYTARRADGACVPGGAHDLVRVVVVVQICLAVFVGLIARGVA